MSEPLPRRLAAEAIGSFILFATVVGSGIMAQRLSAGNDAVALLGNTLATAAMLVVLITKLGPVSGAHFNPAVTLAFVLRRELPVRDLAPFVIAQFLGGIAGVMTANLMFDMAPIVLSTKMRGSTGQWLGEVVATAGLLLTIVGTSRHRPAAVPASVGLYIAAAYWFTSSTSFANPAITIARSLSDSFAGIAPDCIPGFIAAQLVGMALGLVLSAILFPRAASPAP